MKVRRLAAAILLTAIGFALGRLSCPDRPACPRDYGACDRAQLTWAAEGIEERISELEDDLARVRALLSGG